MKIEEINILLAKYYSGGHDMTKGKAKIFVFDYCRERGCCTADMISLYNDKMNETNQIDKIIK